ncbi:MAG: benzoyl-CoA oxygenase/reductase, BoxA protein [Betaproteobacteria bacterium RIFCSPLOWO2_02_FULL_66_14]|nr:MAG: benzoyl-CoA oxygenase/reductase, BoxA protein [Betaproteobacteria bacterium RIFCSPLOWO2_02_FULL_66_14]
MTIAELTRQHLIDPEICIRCNTCEETCPIDAITHDRQNYVVKADVCDGCNDCIAPCPTGAIDSWRRVATPFSIEEQLKWDSLPPDTEAGDGDAASADIPEEVARFTAAATQAQGGVAPPPWSAAHPYVGLYSLTRPASATCAGNYRLTAPDAESDIRHIVLDFANTAFPVLEGQSLAVIVTKPDGGSHVRMYSIASPRNGERPGYNNVSLTVKRVTVDREGNPVRGVASNFLCDLKKGDKLSVAGPFGASFLMPNHPGSSLIMICTGTGSAPMRAMTERRRRRMALKEGGELLLFFGSRRPEELPYFGPLMKLPKELIDVQLAFSRVTGRPREYVQDRMRTCGEKVARLLADPNTYVYLCGHKQMEQGVEDAFGAICGADWNTLKGRLRSAGRYHVETY